MTASNRIFLTTTPGLEDLLVAELKGLNIEPQKQTSGGVWIEASLEDAYRICLWSRLGSRVFLLLNEVRLDEADDLYRGACAIDWPAIFDRQSTFSVDCTGRNRLFTHSGYAALRVKDAIVDVFRERDGERPSIDSADPDVRVSLFIHRDSAFIYLDLSGGSLQARGYRTEAGEAPLREHLASAILLRSNWPAIAGEGGGLVDPLCGSGTFLIEAAQIACDVAPGLTRPRYGFDAWKGHDADLWSRLKDDALARREAGIVKLPQIAGFDRDHRMVSISKANIERAGLKGLISVSRQELEYLENPFRELPTGLVVTNPPYGERLGEVEELGPLYASFGAKMIDQFDGWHASLLTGNPQLCTRIGLEAAKKNKIKNGPIECQVLQFVIDSAKARERAERPRAELSEQAQMLAGRLRKNLKHLGKWAKRNAISCYRLYDSDIPEYAAAIDLYGDRVHIQEYQAPKTIDPTKAAKRMREIRRVTAEVLGIEERSIAMKVRSQQKGSSQYERSSDEGEVLTVTEAGLQFEVNLTRYLDTGLFLDHRPVRAMIRDLSKGKRFLNLFAYTGTASVYAAAGGATKTVSVDLSATYLDWAGRNLARNGFRAVLADERRERHQGRDPHLLAQADCQTWIRTCRDTFDLIFCDPPTFSNSKRMEDVFDIQRDHVELITESMRCLAPGGTMIFSNNFRKFRMDQSILREFGGEEITPKTIDEDFRRDQKIHRCWIFRKGTV